MLAGSLDFDRNRKHPTLLSVVTRKVSFQAMIFSYVVLANVVQKLKLEAFIPQLEVLLPLKGTVVWCK